MTLEDTKQRVENAQIPEITNAEQAADLYEWAIQHGQLPEWGKAVLKFMDSISTQTETDR